MHILYVKNITYTIYITYTEICWRPPVYFRVSRLYYDQKETMELISPLKKEEWINHFYSISLMTILVSPTKSIIVWV